MVELLNNYQYQSTYLFIADVEFVVSWKFPTNNDSNNEYTVKRKDIHQRIKC